MDHSSANLIDLNARENNLTIVSEFDFDTQEKALKKVRS